MTSCDHRNSFFHSTYIAFQLSQRKHIYSCRLSTELYLKYVDRWILSSEIVYSNFIFKCVTDQVFLKNSWLARHSKKSERKQVVQMQSPWKRAQKDYIRPSTVWCQVCIEQQELMYFNEFLAFCFFFSDSYFSAGLSLFTFLFSKALQVLTEVQKQMGFFDAGLWMFKSEQAHG